MGEIDGLYTAITEHYIYLNMPQLPVYRILMLGAARFPSSAIAIREDLEVTSLPLYDSGINK